MAPQRHQVRQHAVPSVNPTIPPTTEGRPYLPGQVEQTKIVQKPVSRAQADNPREYQLNQLRRRFSPDEETTDAGSRLKFVLTPSDPDFPFEMDGLQCILHVPSEYPKSGKPSLQVTNKEMGRGYQINVEKGFDLLLTRFPQPNLLALTNALDRQLEALLTEQKAETIKLVANTRSKAEDVSKPPPASSTPAVVESVLPNPPPRQSMPPERYTLQQKAEARARREVETRQLEARLGRLPLFRKNHDGLSYEVPIQPRRPAELPVPLLNVKLVKLIVPSLYSLEPCFIEIPGVSQEAAHRAETAFERRARGHPEINLMGQINYFSSNLHVMATEVPPEFVVAPEDTLQEAETGEADITHLGQDVEQKMTVSGANDPDDKSHIKVIPRPPEWTVTRAAGDDNDSDPYDSYDSEEDFTDEDTGDGGIPVPADALSSGPERGIAIQFPFLELYGIELLELTSVSLTIKCERCKDQMDISNLRNNTTGFSGSRHESCKKCASPLTIGTISTIPPESKILTEFRIP